jgi:type IX secretion system PorP/SprF family membrane protein
MWRLIFLFFLLATGVKAQEPFIALPFSSPLLLNPGYAGSAETPRLNISSRQELPGQTQRYRWLFTGYDQYVPFLRSGVGFSYFYKYEDPDMETTHRFSYVHSGNFRLGESITFRPSLELVYLHRRLDVRFPQYRNINIFDLSAGILLYSPNVFGGFVIYRIGQPRESYYPHTQFEPMEPVMKFHFGFNIGPESGKFYFSPNIIFYNETELQNLGIGLAFTYDKLSFGVSTLDAESIIFQARYRREKFSISYGGDFNFNNLYAFKLPAHEIAINIFFNTKNRKGNMVPVNKYPL